MKKKAIQTLLYLANQKNNGLNSNNIHSCFNNVPKSPQINIKNNAKQYARQQMENTYGIKIQEPLSKQEQQTAQQIIQRIKQIRKAKSIRLAEFIQKFSKRIIYGQLQEAKQFLQSLDKKQVSQLSFTLDIMHKVIKQRLQREQQYSQTHTIKAAQTLIQELKKTKKIDQL